MIVNGSSSGLDFGWVWMLAVAVYATFVWRKDRKRANDLAKTLLALSFAPLQSERQVPCGWHERGAFKSGYEGVYNGCRAYVVESLMPDGDSGYGQTFVLVERPDAIPWRPTPIVSSLGLEYTQEGRWLIGTVPRQTIGPDAVIGYLQCFT